ncbi:hypothetical protein D9615_004254 [Tricholomella constricta]|uniref:RRM domain-containing protein n=1 Tax=Tricholomella constricta TaxID=117010 RepID=A0A8H5HEQ8_9AGAR|nr:hypothetical protein D9615_004254 [Tricholomella constricta]
MTLKATKDSSTHKNPKVTVTDSKTQQAASKDRKKAKKSAVVEVEVEEVVEASKVSKKRSKKVQSQPIVEEKVEEKMEVVEEKKQKKGKKEGAAGSVAKPEKPTPAPATAPEEPLPVSISAPRKSSTTSKSPKASDKASKISKKAKAKETPPAPVSQEPVPESISTSEASTTSKAKASDKTSKKSKKAKAKEISPSPEPQVLSEEEAAEAGSEKENEDLHLHGFSTDDDDSSDDDDAMDHEPSAFDIAKLPTIAKDDATVKRKLEKAKRQPTEDRGVLFLGRIPHGFYEDQMRGYFSQFGTVTRTGRSKHYGFLEFDSSSVAQIVADTMDNYLLMGHILRCKVIPKDEVHPELWVGANRKWRAVPHDRVTRVEHNKPRTEDQQVRANKRLIKRQNERKRKLADAGIKYDFEAVGYKKAKGIQA